jgi:hypothetical protein
LASQRRFNLSDRDFQDVDIYVDIRSNDQKLIKVIKERVAHLVGEPIAVDVANCQQRRPETIDGARGVDRRFEEYAGRLCCEAPFAAAPPTDASGALAATFGASGQSDDQIDLPIAVDVRDRDVAYRLRQRAKFRPRRAMRRFWLDLGGRARGQDHRDTRQRARPARRPHGPIIRRGWQ